jgi:hypothetical protein
LEPPRSIFEGVTPGVLYAEDDEEGELTSYGFFKKFWTPLITREVVKQTNIYADTYYPKMGHTKE